MIIIRNRQHPWRYHLDQNKWKRQYRRRCLFLCLCLAAELCCLPVRNALRKGLLSVQLIRKEEQIYVEMITRERIREHENGNPDDGELYGIRIHPDTWEIQFYHREIEEISR